jgi:acyl carrier protein
LLGEEPLDFCVLFSSLASVLGGLGFAGYSAANAFLDAFAPWHNTVSSTHWTSVNWDTWQTRENGHGDFGATLKDLVMSPGEALRAFDHVVARATAFHQVVNSTGDLEARLNQWVRRIGLVYEPAAGPAVHPRPALGTRYEPPTNAAERTIAGIWERVLGLEVGIHDNFLELGGNSLIGTQMIGRLRQAFQVSIPLSLLFRAPTVAEMAVAVEMALIEEIEKAGAPGAPT